MPATRSSGVSSPSQPRAWGRAWWEGAGDVVVRPLEEPGAGAALVGLGVKLQGAAFMGLQVLEDKLREAAVLGLELKLLSLKVLVCCRRRRSGVFAS